MTDPLFPTPHNVTSASILSVQNVDHGYEQAHGVQTILQGVNLTLREGEIVALLGRSGSGKSTLLRIISGLITPSAGQVDYLGAPVHGPARGVAMVFQTFALFPWLTVLQNVEAGLEAQGMAAAVRRTRALAAIDLIGLDGFENAYPRELSGGMRQRVGFARALVVDPTLLLMDEPFSALDVLTAETLRTDLLDLWGTGRLPIKSMLIVTHNIEEAVFMCDRILLLSSHPGKIVAEIAVPFHHPRSRLDPPFRHLVDEIYAQMTARSGDNTLRHELKLGSWLPHVSTNLIAGLLETLAAAPYHGRADMPDLALALHMEVDRLFPVAEVLQHLDFASVQQGDIILTPAGEQFAVMDTQPRKALFATHLLRHVPLATLIKNVLDERPGHRAPRVRFEQELEDVLSDDAARETLDTVINWGRYAEIFSYNDQSGSFSLEDVEF
ncbi:nitrate ABC transporter ATP-binding protein [Edwardsiella ictaluri]|uniref:ABC transporter, ATP-binding protein n=2 Tax=Edwardsiella ictaluri TaxID=67780 RepID=C5BBY8_EDWI9|nr:nitrate/sulfonate/bicarbonate ABC transporter ATP-binding protein [Edwardsiella ictaluri]ACR70595.1 ABC transporter, ATP-binding protein [Edwardsiella ictaluri 93-146]AVZ82592.1 nitrate ABC transporter ATP-binding protein [Edwardsiella ictaluri]EKS7761696.1 AAA-associated domain-containing protein [Edwardsiella ictaluri]EKS7769950.1 AAA-associated domain-containing protein [Edwardsiella ictaluri]EKS7773003.1 AAA-associated domain-containing protein [Edwardsiella ictaluri]